jgi:hypothetical protein
LEDIYMAYKFQLGAFTASGSIKAEDGFDANDNNIQNVGTIKVDIIEPDANMIDIALSNGQAQALEIKQGGNAFITANTNDDQVEIGQHLRMAADKSIKFDDQDFIQLDTDMKIVASADMFFDVGGGNYKFCDGGTEQLRIDTDTTAGEIIMQLKVDSDDFVFKQFDGTEVFRVEDDGSFDIAGGAGSSGVTVSAAGQLTADGRVIVDDATDATSTTDGSLQTDGGLSVAKDAVLGNDVKLLSDSAVLAFGADGDVTLTHLADAGLQLNGNMGLAFSDTNSTIGHDATVGGISVVDHAAVKIQAPATEIEASTSIQLDTPIVDFEDDGVILQFGAGDDVTLSHIHDAGLRLNAGMSLGFRDANAQILSGQSEHLDLTASAEIHLQSDNLNIDAPNGVNISHALVVAGNLTVQGTTTQVDTTNLNVKDKNILLNDGGGAASAAGAGIDIEENGSVTGYIRVNASERAEFTMKAPDGSIFTLDMNANGELEYTAAKKLSVGGNFTIDADITTTAGEINLLDGDVAVGSSITIADADGFIVDDGGTTKKIPASDLKTYLADNSFNVALKTDGSTLANGVNYFASASANVSASLPASPSVGDSVMIKAMPNCGDFTLEILKQGSHTIDGAAHIILESAHAAVECVYVVSNTWKVF